MMVKVSVIMPSLNVVKYIEKCMDSVVNQSLKDLEIIAVDAGSTDGTQEIIQTYAERDSRVRLVHSDQKSYGYQINLGLSIARGEYIGIVETDDWIEPDAYEVLYRYACKYGADYVRGVSQLYKEIERGLSYGTCLSVFSKRLFEENNGIIQVNPQEQKDILKKDAYLWNGIYKSSLLQKIKLNETAGAAYQDVGFLVQVYDKSVCAIYIDKLVYHYRKDNEDCSCYSRNAFQYLVEEYRFVEKILNHMDEGWKLYSDVKYFHQIHTRFRLMAGTGTYWEESEPYINDMYKYFQDKQDLLPFLGETYKKGFTLFMNSPVKLYGALKEEYIVEQKNWDAFLHKLRERKIVIFGSGKRGYFLQFLLTKKKTGQLLGYCDNDIKKIGKDIFGLIVRPLDYWIRSLDSICYVVAANAFSVEIVEQLLTNGVLRNNIVLFELPLDFSVL